MRRRRHVDVHPEPAEGEHDRVAHAVAVAQPRHRLALEMAAVLQDRERVADRLDRVVPVAGFAVDHRDGRRVGQLAQHGDGLRPSHDRVEEPREHATGVGHAFSAGQVHLSRPQVDGVAAQFGHPRLEADPGAGRRVVEDHAEVSAGQERRHVQLAMEVLEYHRELDQLEQFLARVHLVGHEVAAAELRQRRQRPAPQHRAPQSSSGDPPLARNAAFDWTDNKTGRRAERPPDRHAAATGQLCDLSLRWASTISSQRW